MIELRIVGETTAEFSNNLLGFAALLAGASTAAPAPQQDAQQETKTTRVRKTAAAAAPETTSDAGTAQPADPTGDAAAAAPAANSEATGASTAPVTRESVGQKCMAYGSPTKGGPAALKELFIEMGSEKGNFTGVPDDKLPELSARLDELLA